MIKKTYPHIRMAIVHDNFRYFGGAERVVWAMKKIWPDAKVFTSTVEWGKLGVYEKAVRELDPQVSWAQRIPMFSRYPFLYRYLLPYVWRSFDFSGYDIVLSSSYAQMSHLIRVPSGVLHICYSHSPPRHLYGYETDFDWRRFIILRPFIEFGNALLRKIDRAAANRINYFIACSEEVKRRISRYYGRPSAVIYPPLLPKNVQIHVSDSRFVSHRYFLVVSRLSRRKHVDLAVRVCTDRRIPLVIAGSGPEENTLRALAGPSVRFAGELASGLSAYYKKCSAVICLGNDEESSIVPIEALYYGKPVIALRSGGYKESVIEDKTGIFFNALTKDDLLRAMEKLKSFSIDRKVRNMQLAKYTLRSFEKKLHRFVSEKYREYTISQS